jgi:hypothetical protein
LPPIGEIPLNRSSSQLLCISDLDQKASTRRFTGLFYLAGVVGGDAINFSPQHDAYYFQNTHIGSSNADTVGTVTITACTSATVTFAHPTTYAVSPGSRNETAEE